MEKQIQKNRYLELDGIPVEATGWRKQFTPLVLASAFGAAALSYNAAEFFSGVPTESQRAPYKFLIDVVAGLVLQRGIRQLKWAGTNDFNEKYVIDTRPTSAQQPLTEQDLKKIKINYARFGAGFFLGSSGIPMKELSLVDSFSASILFTVMAPTMADSIGDFMRFKKINNAEWTVIPRSEMKQEEEKPEIQAELSPSPLPSLT